MSWKSLVVALLTLGLVCEPGISASPVLGQVIVKGQAKITGAMTASGATVFAGDQVTTETNTVAELLLGGGTKVLLPGSSAVTLYRAGDQIVVQLRQGALAILTQNSAPAMVEANGARIKPASHAAVVLEVAVGENSLRVVSRRGSATVAAADKTLEVAEGKELDATMAAASPQGPAGAGAQAARPFATWTIVLAAAAAVTGLALGVVAITRSSPENCTAISTTGKIVCP